MGQGRMNIYLTVIGSLWVLWLIITIALWFIAFYAPARQGRPLSRLDIWLRRMFLLASFTSGVLFVCAVGINLWR